MKIAFSPIGVIHTPYGSPEGVPVQPVFSEEKTATVEVFEEFREGLKDLDGFSHIILIYCFHKSDGYALRCRPFLDTVERGLFATRAPRRPNPVGLSVVELISVDSGTLTIAAPDMVDGTPLLDIKPYIKDFDVRTNMRSGWYEQAANKKQTVADKRFLTDTNAD